MPKQFDILLSIRGELTWACEIYQDSVQRAIDNAIETFGGEYVGHKEFAIVDGAWEEVK